MLKYWSFSAADGHTTCARRFYYERTDPRPPAPDRAAAFALGGQVHTACETVARRMLELKKRSPFDEYLDRLRTGAESVPGPLRGQVLADYVEGVRPLLTLCPPTDKIEVKFRDAELQCSGRIDAVLSRTPVVDSAGFVVESEAGECVVDYKTGRLPYAAWNAHKSVQLCLYCAHLGLRRAAFVSVTDTPPAKVVVARPTDADVARAVHWFKETSATIAYNLERGATAFPMTNPDNPLCCARFCAYHKDKCYPNA